MTSFQLRRPRRAIVLAVLAIAAPALAADPPAKRATVLQQVLDCRAVTDSAARLACYDQAAARFDQAEKAGEVVVVDRGQMREVRRQAFGFTLPSLSMFERGGRTENEDIDQLTTTISRARKDAYGKWILTLEGGAVWRQTDANQLLKDPRPGSKAEIRRGVLGSYLMNIDGQRAVKAERVK